MQIQNIRKNPKTPTSSPLPSPHAYETTIIKSNEDTVGDTYHSLEERVNLLNNEAIAMKSFIKYQMFILRQSTKDSTLWKSHYDNNSDVARLTEDISYLYNKNRTKSCIIQKLRENENTQQRPPAPYKSDFRVPN